MGRFLFSSFFFLWLAAGFVLFPPAVGAQNRPGRPSPGDRFEHTQGSGLVIRSSPSGARVYIDGRQWGTTPLRLRDFWPGIYSVRIEKEGYVDYLVMANVVNGSTMYISVDLQPAIGRVLLNIQPDPLAPSDALPPLNPEISVDRRSYSSPALELNTGFRTILVRAFGWEDASTTLYIAQDSYRELDLTMKPASFKFTDGGISRSRFNPANSGSLGTTSYSFTVSAPGTGTFTVLDSDWKPVFVRSLEPFKTWAQSVVWDGRDGQGQILPDGVYTVVVDVFSTPWDDSDPVEDGFVLNVEIDSSHMIFPLTLSSGKSGLLCAPFPDSLPPGSFQIDGSLLVVSPADMSSEPGGTWTSLPFAAALRFSPLESLEVSAALNVLPRFNQDAGAGIAGGAKWVFLNSGKDGSPLGLAAGAVVSWMAKDAITPFGMASGVELYVPLKVALGSIFSFALSPSALWVWGEGSPWEPVPRLLVSGGLMMQTSYVGAGLSLRTEYDFTKNKPWPPFLIMGAETKFFLLPSSFVFSLMGGMWVRDSNKGGFGGLGIGMIY